VATLLGAKGNGAEFRPDRSFRNQRNVRGFAAAHLVHSRCKAAPPEELRTPMNHFQQTVNETSEAFRRLSRAQTVDEVRTTVREIKERHIPAMENDDRVLAAAARATLRWMARERLEERLRRAEIVAVASG
jgi:hypothetical protein